jgi:hypothetical protein
MNELKQKHNYAEAVEIMFGQFKGVYNVHPVAKLFPMSNGKPYDDLRDSIREIGQQEDVVLDGCDLLDGRNRVAVLNELEMETKAVQFADLQTGVNQGVWIAAKNLERRHLTNDQYIAISARYFDWLKEQAEQNSQSPAAPEEESQLPITSEAVEIAEDNSTLDDYPQKPADNPKPRKRGRPRGQRSEAETLARKTKQSRYRAEQMLKIRAHSPELALAIEEGRITLKEAAAQIPKNVCNPNQADGDHKSEQPERPPEIAKTQRAAIRAIDEARAIAKRLRKSEQGHFWRQIASRAEAILGFEFPELIASRVGSTTWPVSPATKSE